MSKVVVTGAGMISCLGAGVKANWEAVVAGRSGIGPITLFDPYLLATRIGGQAPPDFDHQGRIPVRELRKMERFQQFALVAAAEAIEQAGLTLPLADPFRCGAIIGSWMGGINTVELGVHIFRKKGPKGAHPLFIPKSIGNSGPGIVAMKLGFRGPNFAPSNACASGACAIGQAYRIIRAGRADVMLAGGVEACLTEWTISSLNALRVLSRRNEEPKKASRPFDRDHDGMVISEGAGVLVLESEDHARGRGAFILAEVAGYGMTHDAHNARAPDPDGYAASWSMRLALEEAGLRPEDIGYINAHGSSIPRYDRMETASIKQLFGNAARETAISSTKSTTGNAAGASGGIEAIFAILTLQTGVVPPTINLENSDSECDLDYTPLRAGRRDCEYALSNSFALGGHNICLVFGKP